MTCSCRCLDPSRSTEMHHRVILIDAIGVEPSLLQSGLVDVPKSLVELSAERLNHKARRHSGRSSDPKSRRPIAHGRNHPTMLHTQVAAATTRAGADSRAAPRGRRAAFTSLDEIGYFPSLSIHAESPRPERTTPATHPPGHRTERAGPRRSTNERNRQRDRNRLVKTPQATWGSGRISDALASG